MYGTCPAQVRHGGFFTELITSEMSEIVRIKIMNTPFHHFMHSTPLTIDSNLLDDIIGRYIRNDAFHLGSKTMVCTNEDFGQILGLPY